MARRGLFQCRIDHALAKAAEQAAARAGTTISAFNYELLERCGVLAALQRLPPWCGESTSAVDGRSGGPPQAPV